MRLKYPANFITVEPIPRRITAKGRSAIDADVVVAYFDGSDDPHWIVCDETDVDPHRSYAVAMGRGQPMLRAILLAEPCA